MRKKVLESACIKHDIESAKCALSIRNNCMKGLTPERIHQMRSIYWLKNKYEKNIWLLDTLATAIKQDGANVYRVMQYDICHKCFMKVFHITQKRYYKIKTDVRSGKHAPGIHEEQQQRSRGKEFCHAMNWLEEYVSFHGDRMPHEKTIYLPYKTQKTAVYKQYKNEINNPVAKSTFNSMWRSYFQHVKIKKVSRLF